MGDQEDIMLTFRQKIQLNNDEHMFFRQEVDSWRNEMQNQQDIPSTLEDISGIESSEEDESSDPLDELVEKGTTLIRKGEFARAISIFTSAISKKRTSKCYAARALAYLKRCNLSEAEKDCTEAINLDPQFTRAYLRRALARKLLGKCKESCEDLEMILKLDPDNAIAAMEYEAMLDYLQKNLPNVKEPNAEQEKQETAVKLKQLGNDFVSKCDYNKAIIKFTRAIELNPKDPTFYGNRAICLMKLKDFISAEKDCSTALELDRKYAKVYLRRARVRKCLGKLYESRQDFYSAFELTRDEQVLEELEEVEGPIRQMEARRRNQGEEVEIHNIFSVLENDELGHPKRLQLNCLKPKIKQLVTAGDAKIINDDPPVDKMPPSFLENDHVDKKYGNGTACGTQKETKSRIIGSSLQQTNTVISIPESKLANDSSTKYDIREVFPLNRSDPSAKFTGPFVRIIVEDGKFASPEKLLEIPEGLMRNLLPR